ncbi:MAG TPA: TadE/TadG family type IV pilus assembly protein [Anaerolineae bacterium]|nr:TadE/TadG family type IV pilus assembly protein [Anaerolineae bacterium]
MFVRGQRGQTLVEFALVLPILVLLLVGMLEVGRLLNAWLIVSNGAREGARYATVGVSEAEVIAKVKEACTTLDPDSLVVEVTGAQGPRGSPVTVRVESTVEVVPLIGALLSENPFPVSAKAAMGLE